MRKWEIIIWNYWISHDSKKIPSESEKFWHSNETWYFEKRSWSGLISYTTPSEIRIIISVRQMCDIEIWSHMYVELYIASKHQSAKSSAGSTMVVPQHYHGDRSKLLCFRNFFTATAVVLPRPRKQCNFNFVTRLVPRYYLRMIWRINTVRTNNRKYTIGK